MDHDISPIAIAFFDALSDEARLELLNDTARLQAIDPTWTIGRTIDAFEAKYKTPRFKANRPKGPKVDAYLRVTNAQNDAARLADLATLARLAQDRTLTRKVRQVYRARLHNAIAR